MSKLQHIINKKEANTTSVVYSYCPDCDKCPKNDTYERISNNVYKCSNCGYVGSKETFINKLIINPKDI